MIEIIYTARRFLEDESCVRVETGKPGDSTIDLCVTDDHDMEAAGLTLMPAEARKVRDALDKALAAVGAPDPEPTNEQAEALAEEIMTHSWARNHESADLIDLGRAAWLRGARPKGLIGS